MIEVDEKFNNLNRYMNDMLKINIYSERKVHVNTCPRCGKKHYIKYGSFKGIQRYRCKECGKTFSLVTNAIWSYSKKDASKWVKFVGLNTKMCS